jgi:UDP:flavonoid glycosyltransferase YjiC (YdhE family)
MVPYFVEQQMLAYRLRERGLGEFAPSRSDAIVAQARKVLSSKAHARGARALAERYRNFVRECPIVNVADACERVLACP